VSSQNSSKRHRRHLDVTPVSSPDSSEEPFEAGDRVRYTGCNPAIALICSGKTLEILGIQEGLSQCWVAGFAGLINVPLRELLQQD
jgi:hypothetical protein